MSKNKKVLSALQSQKVGVLATIDSGSNKIRQRIMYYGADGKFNIYFMSSKKSPKVTQMLSNPEVSFIVYGMEEPFDNTWEIEIEGTTGIIEDAGDKKSVLKRLKDKNPFANVAFESNIIEYFNFICLVPKTIKYSVYGEILKGDPPVIIRL